jgi:4-amino-4-deoxy-L-arabinose transferase-like glycosyltransferase
MFGPTADPTVPTAYYPVGYPALLGALYAVLGEAPWVIALAGSLAGAGTVALVHRLARRVSSPGAARLAALGLALLPGQVLFASTPMTETLWGLTLTLAVYLVGWREGSLSSAAATALALALAVYVRPQAARLAPARLRVGAGTWRLRARQALLVTALTALAVLPWSARNCRAVDGCAFVSTNGGGNLAIGALPGAVGTFRFLTASDGCRGVVGEVARDRCWRGLAWAAVRRDPSRWLRLAGAKFYHTYAYEAFPVGYLRTARPDLLGPELERRGRVALSIPWRCVYLLALLALLPLYPRRGVGLVGARCLAATGVVLCTHLIFFGGDRYHLPVTGLLLVVASGALRELHGRAPSGRLRAVDSP